MLHYEHYISQTITRPKINKPFKCPRCANVGDWVIKIGNDFLIITNEEYKKMEEQ